MVSIIEGNDKTSFGSAYVSCACILCNLESLEDPRQLQRQISKKLLRFGSSFWSVTVVETRRSVCFPFVPGFAWRVLVGFVFIFATGFAFRSLLGCFAVFVPVKWFMRFFPGSALFCLCKKKKTRINESKESTLIKDVRANCLCASFLRTQFTSQCQAMSRIEQVGTVIFLHGFTLVNARSLQFFVQ